MTQPLQLITSIVAYRTDPQEIVSSIESAHRTTHPHEVFVVDNSPDASLEEVVRDAGAIYIKTERNIGFGAAHNLVLKDTLARAPFCLALNPDSSFEAGVLDELIAFLTNNPDVGLMMPRIFYPDGSEQHLCKLLPSPQDLIARRFGGSLLRSIWAESMRRFQCERMDRSKPLNIPYLSGCFMLMRTAALRQVGLFDERFFMYFEDLDLCRRIHRRFSTIFYPYAGVTHRHERGSYSDAKLLRTHIRSALLYFSKYGWFFDPERRSVNAATEEQEVDRWNRVECDGPQPKPTLMGRPG